MAIETTRIEGLANVLDTLKRLPPEIVSKRGGPVRAALNKSARMMQKQVIANLDAVIAQGNVGGEERSTGLLRKNIVVTRSSRKQNGEAYSVRVRNKAYPKLSENAKRFTTAQNARLLEYGTEKRQPYPFIRPAFEAKKAEAVQVFTDELNKRLAAIIRKLDKDR